MVAEALITALAIITDMAIPSEGSKGTQYIFWRAFLYCCSGSERSLGVGLFFRSLSSKHHSIVSRLNFQGAGFQARNAYNGEAKGFDGNLPNLQSD